MIKSITIARFLLAGLAVLAGLAGPVPTLAAPGAHGPNGEHLDAPSAAAAPAVTAPATNVASGLLRLADGSINVPKQAQRRLGLRTVVTATGAHPTTVELNARIDIDPNAGGRVQAPFSGQIEPGPKGLPVAGQTVKKGQVLAMIRPIASAIDRGNQQAELAEIRASQTLAQQRLQRLLQLEGSVPQKEIDAARAEVGSLGGRERAIAASVGGRQPLLAPASGVIASASILNGQIVEARDILFDIVDPRRMMVQASSTDASLADRIAGGSLVGYPKVALRFVGSARSLRDGALPLNFLAATNGAALAINQPVSVVVRLTDQLNGAALPAAALVRNQANEPVVWVKTGPERFIAQPVQVQSLDGETIVVLKGLTADARVVVAGASLINQIR
ncbi:MAG: HlyD family efflux transporter periplasmic adaptor subunit [Pseudomonadota bacterium]